MKIKKQNSFMLGFVIVLTTLQIKALPVFDSEFACTSDSKADQYIRDFNIDVTSFGGKELCDSKFDSKKLFNDLQLIEEGRFAENGQNNILIRNFVPIKGYYPWLKGETEGMSRGNDVPFATAYNSMGYFTMQDGWAVLSTLGRVGVVIHEARHTDGFRHIPCKQGPYQGFNLPGCDSHYEYAGSHAVEMEYYARVVTLGENFHPLYKKMARLMAMGRANFVFNQAVIQKREALFLISENHQDAYLIDGNNIHEREVSGEGILKRTSHGASFFSQGKAFGLDPYEWVGDLRPTEDGYSYFKLLSVRKNLPSDFNVKDMEEFDEGSKRFIVTLDQNGRYSSYQFQEGQWGPLKNLNSFKPERFKTRLANNETGLFIINEKNEVIKYSTQKLEVENNVIGTWPSHVLSYVSAPQTGTTLQLTQQGDLLQMNGQPFDLTRGQRFSQAVNIPLYNAFTVKTGL